MVGATVMRGEPAIDPVPPESSGTRQILVVALGIAVMAALGTIIWVVLAQPVPARPSPTVSVPGPPPDVDDPVPPPGTPVVSCVRKSGTVRCSWTYTNPLPNDQFEWRMAGSSARVPTQRATASFASEGPACIEVKVFREDGSYAPPVWTKGCAT